MSDRLDNAAQYAHMTDEQLRWLGRSLGGEETLDPDRGEKVASMSLDEWKRQNGVHPNSRTPISDADRFTILKRDKFRCQTCGVRAPHARMELDHRVSVADGGPSTPQNLWVLCARCNRGKGARSL